MRQRELSSLSKVLLVHYVLILPDTRDISKDDTARWYHPLGAQIDRRERADARVCEVEKLGVRPVVGETTEEQRSSLKLEGGRRGVSHDSTVPSVEKR